ncbi:MAG: lipase [Deltaproteobacteria bacterium RBG_19FT_COMBO_43_11]|nr:MAG: lipase [Deltaproteobacteria bacterium RBG_19FT_COMBO_43_11]
MANPVTNVSKLKIDDNINLCLTKNFVDNPKAAVIIVHGLCEHAGRYDYVVSRLNDFGYSVYRFDNRGHGLSDGARGHIEDYNIFINDTDKIVEVAKSEQSGIPLFTLGHSMGGFITAFYGMKYPGIFAGQIFCGAALTLNPSIKSFDYNAMPIVSIPNTFAKLICRDPQVVKAFKQDTLVLKEFTAKLYGEVRIKGARHLMDSVKAYKYPCLILHGGGDLMVDPNSSRYFYGNISSTDKQLKIYDGLYHEILNEPEKDTVIEDINFWIKARI